jgi:hypothetical protein
MEPGRLVACPNPDKSKEWALIGKGRDQTLMAIHKEILEWQAAHPNTTWLAWGITWLVILSILFWPLC